MLFPCLTNRIIHQSLFVILFYFLLIFLLTPKTCTKIQREVPEVFSCLITTINSFQVFATIGLLNFSIQIGIMYALNMLQEIVTITHWFHFFQWHRFKHQLKIVGFFKNFIKSWLLYKIPDWLHASWNCLNSLTTRCWKLRLVFDLKSMSHGSRP